MNANTLFSPQRLFQLIKRDLFYRQQRTWMIAGAVIVLLLIVIVSWMMDGDNDAISFHIDAFPLTLFFGGFLFTSYCFRELDNPQNGQLYLTLPVSNLERFASKWLITTVFFVVFATVAYFIFSLIASAVAQYFFNLEIGSFNPFSEHQWKMIRLYVVLQSIFFLGAITFRRFAWVKTILSGGLLSFIFAIILFLIIYIVFYEYFDGFTMHGNRMVKTSGRFGEFMEDTFTQIMKFVFWIIMPLVLWTVSYFKITEKEL